MTYLLAGDIGGTKTILRLVRSQESATSGSLPPQEIIYEATYRSADFIDLVPMVGQFLTTATEATGISPEVERACFGIAGPVLNQRSDLHQPELVLVCGSPRARTGDRQDQSP